MVLAGIAMPNPASVRLHESAGFEHLGTMREVGHKLGRWVDVAWYQQLLLTATPRYFAAVRTLPAGVSRCRTLRSIGTSTPLASGGCTTVVARSRPG